MFVGLFIFHIKVTYPVKLDSIFSCLLVMICVRRDQFNGRYALIDCVLHSLPKYLPKTDTKIQIYFPNIVVVFLKAINTCFVKVLGCWFV